MTLDAQWHAWTILAYFSQEREFTKMPTNMKMTTSKMTSMRSKLVESTKSPHICTLSHLTSGRPKRTGITKWMKESPLSVSHLVLDGLHALQIKTFWGSLAMMEFRSKFLTKAQWLSQWRGMKTFWLLFITLVFQFTKISSSNSKWLTAVAYSWRQATHFIRSYTRDTAQCQKDHPSLGWDSVRRVCSYQWMIMVSCLDSTLKISNGPHFVIWKLNIQRLSSLFGSLALWKMRCSQFKFHQTATSPQWLSNLSTKKKSYKFLFFKLILH